MDFLPNVRDPEFRDVSILAVDEPVLGGLDGNDNRPHRELAERDLYLKAESERIDAALQILKGRVDGIDLSSGTQVRAALLLSWLYKEDSPSFELFAPGFSWRDIAPIAVTAASAGDDTLDLASTEGLQVGRSYVLMDAGTLRLETVEILAIISATRVRTRVNLAHTIVAADGAFLARTSFAISDGYATLQDGDVLFTRTLTELRAQASGQLVVRRAADDAGTLTVGYRAPTTTAGIPYAVASRTGIVANSDGTRDEFYALGVGGPIEFRIGYANPDATKRTRIDHMVLLPPARAVGNTAVAQPSVVAPADQAANVGQTPTLQLSPYRALYNVPQGGARFQVASDPTFANLVLDTASDVLAAWNAVTGQSTAFADVLALGTRDFLAVASGVSLRIQIAADGTLTTTPGSVTGDLRRVHGSAALIAAVGAAGAIRTSTDAGASYTVRTAAASYAGTFSGVFVRNAFVVAVGDAGTIQRSVNAGAIFNAVSADNGYAGTFTDLAGDGAGNLIAVGSGGEIQTSANDGQTWAKRVAPGNYAGTYRAVAMGVGGFAVAVGDNGAIHVTRDYGASWAAKVPAASFAGAFYGVAVQGNAVVAVGASATIQTSTDQGETFAARTAGGGATASLRAVALDPGLYGLALGDGGAVQRTLRLEGVVSSFTVPSGYLQTGKVYWARGLYTNQDGATSPFSAAVAFATAATFAYVNAPQIVTPASGDTGVSLQPVIQTGPFSTTGQADTHAASRYQVATSASFAAGTILDDSGEIGDLLGHQVATVLPSGQQLYARAYHKGTALGAGAWSAPVPFQSQNRPNRPTITNPTDGATGLSTGPQITLTAFSMPGGGTQDAVQIQVSTGSAFAALTYDSGVVTAPASFSGFRLPSGSLPTGQKLYVRARQRAVGGAWSAWSATVGFTTATRSNVADVFGMTTILANGNPTALNVGVDLAGRGGSVLTFNRAPLADVGYPLAVFSSSKRPGKFNALDNSAAGNPEGSWNAQCGITGFTDKGAALGFQQGAINTAGYTQPVYVFAQDPGFYLELLVTKTQATQAVDLSALGAEVGFVQVHSADSLGVAVNWGWHRSSGDTFESGFDGSAGNTPGLGVSGATLSLLSALPNGRQYLIRVLANDPGPNGRIVCDTIYNFPGSTGLNKRAEPGWAVQFMFYRQRSSASGGTSSWFMADTMRGLTAPTQGYNLLGRFTEYTSGAPVETVGDTYVDFVSTLAPQPGRWLDYVFIRKP